MDYIRIACARLGVASDQVLVQRIEGDELVLVVDRGIAGCPKYRLPLAGLRPSAPPALPEVATQEDDASPELGDDQTEPTAARKRGRPRRTVAAGELP